MTIQKGIVGRMSTWQEYRDAIVAITKHLTGKAPVRDDKHWQEAFAELQQKTAAGSAESGEA